MNNEYYCYVLLDPRRPGKYEYKNFQFEFEPYYVGKGKGWRFHRHFTKHESDRDYNNIKFGKIRKIRAAGFDPSKYYVLVIKDTDETSAFNLEKSLISYIGRLDLKTGPLANLTEGGDGTSHLLPIIKGKTYEEIYGEEKALKLKEVRRARMLGEKNPMFGKPGPMLGKKLDDVARKKVSVSRRLKVNQLDLNENLIRTWDTVEEAANHVGIYYSGIQHVASRISSDRTAGGFKWQYVGRSYKSVDTSSKPVYSFTDGVVVEKVTNVSKFCKTYNLDTSNIKKVINGKYKSSCGWKLLK